MDKTKKSIYNAFCQKANLPVYVRDWFMDAACQEGEWDVVFEEKKGSVIAVWPYFIKKKYGFTYLTMPPFVPFLGPYLLPEFDNLKDQHRIYASLESKLPSADSFNQNLHPSVSNWLPFYWKNYRQNTRYTYQLNIEDLKRVFNNFAPNIRGSIKKASQMVEITEEGTPEQFYEINKMTFDRQGIKVPYSSEVFFDYIGSLQQHQTCKLFFARDKENRIHAVCGLVKDRNMAYYNVAGGNPELRNSGAGILLIWHIIQFAKEQWGVKVFDFEGSMIKNVEQIWHRAGAHQVAYFNIRKNNSNLFNLLEKMKGR